MKPDQDILQDACIYTIDNLLPFSFTLDQAGIFKNGQVMTDRGIGYIKLLADLPSTFIPGSQQFQDSSSGWVG
jgi:hypothetical protein